MGHHVAAMDYSALRSLGLRSSEIRCYALLYDSGPILASSLATQLGILRPNAYLLLRRLEAQQFVHRTKCSLGPTLYTAQPIATAMAQLHAQQRQSVNSLIANQEISNRDIR